MFPVLTALFGLGLVLSYIFLFITQKRPAFSGTDNIHEEITGGIKDIRLICASPAVTEIVFALGLGDNVVGVSQFSTYPPEARKKARIGGLFNPSRERIIALNPDLVISQGEHAALSDFCREKGIQLLSVPLDSLEDIKTAVRTLGKKLGAGEKAAELVQSMEKEIEAVKEATRGKGRKKVFLTLSHLPGDLTGILTTGPGTFLDKLIQMAGGENIFADTAIAYPRISKESLLVRSPEVIIEILAQGLTPRNKQLLLKDWKRLPTLPAVREGKIHFLSETYLLIPGPRITQTIKRLAGIIHPEVFNDHKYP
ncbi:MAG: cobalamin-binding protein [Candidatus Aminicenantes bacterium]|nr:cobalamin-binding protein [Candidatus Aminicenantes bacterium]